MWEYQTHYIQRKAPFGNITGVKIDDKFNKFMAEMGMQGWELVAATPTIFAGTHQGDILYFKRPIPNEQRRG